MRQRVLVVVGEVVGDAGDARVHVRAAELFGGDDLAGRGLHQRRPAQKDRALPLTMTVSSLIAGTYAPPAVHEPITAAICGMRLLDMRA